MTLARILLIVGPTAVGKTAVAVPVAEAMGGEIISLDSRQMIRGLDIGTAKPTAAERARVPHHLVDVVPPDAAPPLSVVLGQVGDVIGEVLSRQRRPFLVGGTGQYVRALREGWRVPQVPPDPALRTQLAAVAEEDGGPALHDRLAAVDPVAAQRIDARNVRRVIRALEVHAHTGRPMSEVQASVGPDYDILTVGLTRPRKELYARIDARIEDMLAAGLESEVQALLAAGYTWQTPAMSSLGYGEWHDYLQGEIGRDEVIRRIRHNTRRLARNQYAWFRLNDDTIQWFDLSKQGAEAEILGLVAEWFDGAGASS